MRLQVETTERVAVVDVTGDIAGAVPDSFETGVCAVAVPHTTAGVIVNEHEARLVADVERLLGRLVPRGGDYAHDDIDDNADAHLRAMLLGASATVPAPTASSRSARGSQCSSWSVTARGRGG